MCNNYDRCYPNHTTNKNVPSNSFLLFERSRMSGEVITTYYSDVDGNLFGVGDWINDKPYPASMHKIAQLTGDTERMITLRASQYFQSGT